MRTVTITNTYEVFKFNELSESAKEEVKRWYLDHQEAEFFTEQCKEDLRNLFGENNLEVQYSLASCQGDGFNIYGMINAEAIFNCLEKHNGGCQLEEFENMFTEEEKRTILNYGTEVDIKLPYNRHYCYSLADRIDIVDEWQWYFEEDYSKEVLEKDRKLLEKFENIVRGIFFTLCRDYEKQGYEFFYEINEEDLEEECDSNDWDFLKDGTLFI